MSNPLKRYPELLTDIVFLIGNGASRENFDLNTLRGKGTIIGCNALYRDFMPDILICQDAKMAKELYDNHYSGLVLSGRSIGIKTRKMINWRGGNARTSGVFALKFIANIMKPSICYALGMDGYDGNVYEGTQNYVKGPVNYKKITEQYSNAIGNLKTVNVNFKDNWNIVKPNYSFITYKQFMGV